jgi:hypothetical protein
MEWYPSIAEQCSSKFFSKFFEPSAHIKRRHPNEVASSDAQAVDFDSVVPPFASLRRPRLRPR